MRTIVSNHQTPINIFIVDDHEVVRQGLKAIFQDEPEIKLVGESDGQKGVLGEIIKAQPDIVLLDIRISGSDGFEIASQLNIKLPSIKILMISGYESELYLYESLNHKVKGFIPKGSSKAYVCAAIKMIALGGTVWHDELLYRAIYGLRSSNEALNKKMVIGETHLKPRELKILGLLAKGKLNKEISGELQISIDTVKKDIQQLKKKYGALNRIQLATIATEMQLK
ncbi:response regulator transcription factor [Dehalococcoides mccartyi]|jgi:DNA-binding NarL/FixJ family response regulator|uniref:response regulator transcription factor n=1 Tax=Dehalococcoides mccartyi TaxID=61435 RepID=UPI0003C84EFE|nr:response regulator transcription factor [Dehalococcoides mccartyi]AHB12883.1 LuxR family DNA-binding response regulator [Dehalococcoides mccartyi GY50]AII57321.1 chemotaxis protein CheY [Dehalococcoides mccartyi CG1]